MSSGEHKVVLYVRTATRQFSATARKQSSRLSEVDRQISDKGYRKLLVAEGLKTSEANDLKSKIERVCTE